MTTITIIRNFGAGHHKFTERTEVRELGKAGRQARLFAKNRAKQTACNKPNRVENAIVIAQATKPKAKIDITHRPVGTGKQSAHYTVRAKEKYRGKQREPIRI